jgi:uncharacterized protein (DUF2236 family)
VRPSRFAVPALRLALPDGRPGDPGLFGPGSETWRIGRERVLLAGGPPALLLQLAHPLVAAGVAEHSGFALAPLERLQATLDATLTVTFGDREQARAAAQRVAATHRGVRGVLPAAVGPYPPGTPYSALDPRLDLWVHATLVVAALDTYHLLVRPVSPERRGRYYEESKRFAAMFGVPEPLMPPTYEDFRRYVEDMVGRLAVGEVARELAARILAPPVPAPLGLSRPALLALTAALLPPAVREAYRLPFGPLQRALVLAVRASVRATLPLVPERVRYWPHYLTARRRVGGSRE